MKALPGFPSILAAFSLAAFLFSPLPAVIDAPEPPFSDGVATIPTTDYICVYPAPGCSATITIDGEVIDVKFPKGTIMSSPGDYNGLEDPENGWRKLPRPKPEEIVPPPAPWYKRLWRWASGG